MLYHSGKNLYFKKYLKIKYRSHYQMYQPCFYNNLFPEQIDFICSDNYKDSYYDIKCNVFYSDELLDDGYSINITESEICIHVTNERSIKFAFNALTKYIYLKDGICVVELIELIENPTYKYRGVIEGFYGAPYTFEQRIDLFKLMGDNLLNTYFYAPKDDLKHRSLWREKYLESEVNVFSEMIKVANNNMVDFVYCISPGKDVVFSDVGEIEKLVYKLKQLLACNCTKFAILFDDINPKLEKEDAKFDTPAKAQSIFTNTIFDEMKKLDSRVEFFFCPTEYYGSNITSYKKEIGQHLNKEIKIFFTGPEVLSNKIDEKYIIELRKILDHEVVIWDNIPVNDYANTKHKILISPYINRSDKLNQHNVVGFFSNPMIQYEASKIPLITMAEYMWNASNFNPAISFKSALDKYDSNCSKQLYTISSILTNEFLQQELNSTLKIAIINENYNELIKYYEEIKEVIDYLEVNLNKELLNDLIPVFNRFKKSRELLNKWVNKESTNEELKLYIDADGALLSYDIIEEIYKEYND